MKNYASLIFSFILLLLLPGLHAQDCSNAPFSPIENPFATGNFDFIHVRTAELTVGTGVTIDKYIATRNAIANQILNTMNGPVGGSNCVLNDRFTIKKFNYAQPFTYGNQTAQPCMIFIRPNAQGGCSYSQDLPCVLVTHGNPSSTRGTNANMENYQKVADFVLRGYAVAFYETLASQDIFCGNACDTILANNKNLVNFCINSPYLNYNAPVAPPGNIIEADMVQQFFYLGYQYANAAAKFVQSKKTEFKINDQQIFAFSGSYGGFCTMSLAYADANNFTNSLFTCLGNKNARLLPGIDPNSNVDIKAISVTAGGFPGFKDDGNNNNDSKMGEFIDASDQNTPIMMVHGRTDDKVPVNEGWFVGVADLLWYEGTLKLQQKFNSKQIRNWAYVHCHAKHSTFVEPSNAKFMAWQGLDYGTATGKFFKLRLDEGNNLPVYCFKKQDVRTSDCILTNGGCGDCIIPGSNGRIQNYVCNCSFVDSEENDRETQIEEDDTKVESMSILPNPTTGNLVVNLLTNQEKTDQIIIVDIYGKQVSSDSFQFERGLNQIEMDISHLPRGIYCLKIGALTKWVIRTE